MAIAGQIIENPISGERIVFVETVAGTGGKYAVRERIVQPGYPHEQRAHGHATLTETFEILEGVGRHRLGGKEKGIVAGSSIVMPPQVPHIHPWNVGTMPLRMRQTVTIHTTDVEGVIAVEDYLVTTFGLAREGKLRPDGSPSLLQTAVSFHAMLPHAYLAGIPLSIQRILFAILGRLGEARGYQVRYERFAEQRERDRVRPEDAQAALGEIAAEADSDFAGSLALIAEVVRARLRVHQVGLFLVDEEKQALVYWAGTGEIGEQLLARDHGFKLDAERVMVAQVARLGELRAAQIKYSATEGVVRIYSSVPPPGIQPESDLRFDLLSEISQLGWQRSSVSINPQGWEVCLPLRAGDQIVGVLDLYIVEFSPHFPRRAWPASFSLWGPIAEDADYAEFSLRDCAVVQWLADQLGERLLRRGRTLG